MKVFIYLMVFCMLLFLLVLSFDEGRQSSQISEFDQSGATVMSEIDGTWTTQTENAAQMQLSDQIQTAQKEQTTAWDLAISNLNMLTSQWGASIIQMFDSLKKYTKESAYTVVSDMAEMVYPTKKSMKTPVTEPIPDRNDIPVKENKDNPIKESVPLPPTMANKE